MYLIDTNVISEARKGGRADAGVRAFWRRAKADQVYVAVQTLGEIQSGVESIRRRGDEAQAALLERWLETVSSQYAERVLAFDLDCARVWGGLMARGRQNPIDKQIAAVALIHDLIVVTRNVRDFEGTGVRTFDPFGGA